jgi:hypothetical protein
MAEFSHLRVAEKISDLLDTDAIIQITERQFVAHLIEKSLVRPKW